MIKLAKIEGKPEVFYTIQGEGKNLGKPSIFIRCSLCNLHCIWCDTDYTWNWEKTRFRHVNDEKPGYQKFRMEEWISELEAEEIVSLAQHFACKHIVLTGGEPMMQQEGLVKLMRALKKIATDYSFEIETNGTILPEPEFDALIDQYNVSPKLANSKNAKKLREKPEVYHYFAKHEKAYFKFVITRKTDLREVLELIEKYKIDKQKVYLMAEGTSAASLRKKQLWLVEICKKYGFNFTDRLHIQLYGDKKGV